MFGPKSGCTLWSRTMKEFRVRNRSNTVVGVGVGDGVGVATGYTGYIISFSSLLKTSTMTSMTSHTGRSFGQFPQPIKAAQIEGPSYGFVPGIRTRDFRVCSRRLYHWTVPADIDAFKNKRNKSRLISIKHTRQIKSMLSQVHVTRGIT